MWFMCELSVVFRMVSVFFFCVFFVLVIAVALVACASTTMSAQGYDATCSVDGDCVAVFEGDVCGCSCNTAALRRPAAAQYSKDSAEKAASCGSRLECVACPSSAVACLSGTCKVTGQVGAAPLPAPDSGARD